MCIYIYVYIYCSVKNPVLKFLWQSVKYQQEIPLSKKSVKCLAPRLAREPGAKIPQQNVVKALALSLANSTVKACQDMSSLVKLTGSGLPWRSTDLNLRWPHWHVDEKGANIGNANKWRKIKESNGNLKTGWLRLGEGYTAQLCDWMTRTMKSNSVFRWLRKLFRNKHQRQYLNRLCTGA